MLGRSRRIDVNGDRRCLQRRHWPSTHFRWCSRAYSSETLPTVPDPELIERPRRRQLSAEYKLGVVRRADACTRPGEIGALLRREGLYSSLLTEWRSAREAGALEALERPRGRKAPHPLEAENIMLRRRAERAEAELEKTRKVIEVQGNVSALLGQLLEPRGAEGSTKR